MCLGAAQRGAIQQPPRLLSWAKVTNALYDAPQAQPKNVVQQGMEAFENGLEVQYFVTSTASVHETG